MAKKAINTIAGYDIFTGPIYGTVEVFVSETNILDKQKNAARRYRRFQSQHAALMKKRAEKTKHK